MSVASKPSPRMFMVHPKPSGGFEWAQAPWGPVLRCRPLLEYADHLFTAGDLELVADEREWSMVAGELGVDREHLLLVRQVHGAPVAIPRHGRAGSWVRPEADIIASDDSSAAIGV